MAYIKPSGQQCKYEEQDGMQEHVSMREKARQGNIHRVGIQAQSYQKQICPQQKSDAYGMINSKLQKLLTLQIRKHL